MLFCHSYPVVPPFSLPQNVTITTFSMRVSVWTIVLMTTLPVDRIRSVCVATLIVPHVMDRVLMTVLRVTTWKLSFTMESVCLSVPATLTMIRLPMNAVVRKVEVFFWLCKYNKYNKVYFCIMHLFTGCLDFPRMWQFMSDLLRPWALILSQLWHQQT